MYDYKAARKGWRVVTIDAQSISPACIEGGSAGPLYLA